MVWYFIGVYIINRTLHGRLEMAARSLRSLVKYFSTREQKSSVCYSYPVDSVIHLLSKWGLGPPVRRSINANQGLTFYPVPFSLGQKFLVAADTGTANLNEGLLKAEL